MGGDAQGGYESAGRYYVGGGGAYRQVSKEQWEWSRLHAGTALATSALGLAGIYFLLGRFAVPPLIGRRNLRTSEERVRTVRASGNEMASARCSGQIGAIYFRGASMRVSVFPMGVLVEIGSPGPVVILSSEVRSLGIEAGLFIRHLRVNHSGHDAVSPLLMKLAQDTPVARAIEGICGMAFTRENSA